jgi:hypothetical protein
VESIVRDTREYRADYKEDRKEIIFRLDSLRQDMLSTGNAVTALVRQDVGPRIARNTARIEVLEEKVAGLPMLADDVQFFRRVLGVGWQAAWRLVAIVVGSGGVGALIIKAWK